jgi:predicted nucleic acid-binding Zn ribbon protein
MTTPSDHAKALAALRPRQTAVCEVCGTAWQALVRPKQPARTCSPACRQKLHRRRKRGAR